MKKMQQEFAKACGEPNLERFNMERSRLNRDQYRAWVVAMNQQNREAGRWVYEGTLAEIQKAADEKAATEKAAVEKAATEKAAAEKAATDNAATDNAAAETGENDYVQVEEIKTTYEEKMALPSIGSFKDYIDRMYDIHDLQSRRNNVMKDD